MKNELPIGVLHLDVRHGRVAENREALAFNITEAVCRHRPGDPCLSNVCTSDRGMRRRKRN